MARKDDKKSARHGKHDTSRTKRPAPARDEESREEEFVEVDTAAQVLDTAVKKTPWWAISVAFHVVVLACLGLITFAKVAVPREEERIVIQLPVEKVKRVEIPDNATRGLRDLDAIPGPRAPDEQDTPRFEPAPDSVESDHDESADGDTAGLRKGDPGKTGWFDFGGTGMGRAKEGKGTNVSIGVGGGSGGGGRGGNGLRGGMVNRHRRYKGGRGAQESAVGAGLRWLARHQAEDGHWSTTGFDARCAGTSCARHAYDKGFGEFDVGVTGLALLAFLGAGYTPQINERIQDPVTKKILRHGDTVRRGIDWLIKHQNADGSFGPQVGEAMYNNSIAALALSEAYGLTNAVAYRAPAQKAINFIHQSQNYGLAWRYTAKCGQNDTSVTGWCVMALKSAQISGLDVAQTSYEGAKAWIQRVTQDNGQTGYDRLGSGEIFVPGKNEAWQHHPSMTAVGMLCRIFIDKNKSDPALKKGQAILAGDLPKWDPKAQSPTVDFYYWYYAVLALYQYDPQGPVWSKWSEAIKNALCPTQRLVKDGCLDGSWDTGGVDRWAYAGGRVYGTAINVLTLEVQYRYDSVLGGGKRN